MGTKPFLALRPGETKLVLLMSFLLLANSAALAVSNVVSVSGFLSEVGVNEILLVWIVDMLLVAVATGVQSLIVDRFDRVNLLRWMSFGFAMTYVILRMMFVFHVPGWINYSILFLLTEQQWLFFPVIFWILANDLFDMAQSKRLFPLIASGNFIGQIIGLGIASAAPELLARLDVPSAELLSMNVLIYLVIFLGINEGLRGVKSSQRAQKPETVREALTEGWGFVRDVPSFRFLTLVMITTIVGLTVLQFHFLVISDKSFDDAASFQTFYGLYSLITTVIAVIIQALFTSRIINRFQLKSIFFIFPVLLLLSLSGLLTWPSSMIAVAIAFTLPRLCKETIDESARKSFQALVPEERRGRVSMFMDSYLFSGGAVIGSVFVGLVLLLDQRFDLISPYTIYLGIAFVATAISLWFAVKMYRVYDASLLNWRLKRRQRAANVLNKLEF
jgi:ATP/ADP translocase